MWWGVGFAAILYLVLIFTLGVMTLRKGHWVMFIFGIFLPIFWLKVHRRVLQMVALDVRANGAVQKASVVVGDPRSESAVRSPRRPASSSRRSTMSRC